METINSLLTAYEQLKQQQPQLRIRDAAKQLQTTEAELVALSVGKSVTRLRPEFEQILSEIEQLGKVMALSRNNEVIHERKGNYLNFSTSPHAWLFVGKDIDLRIFPSVWAYAFAVQEGKEDEPRHSLQFFAKDGSAVHKIYLEKTSNMEFYHELVAKYTAENQSSELTISEEIPLESEELSDSEIDTVGFQETWVNLKDTHDFFGMLKKFKVTRTQALRLAPTGDYAKKVENNTLRKALFLAAEDHVSIMVFVGNAGMIQIHTGTVAKIVEHGPWINVLDPDFNLHVREDAVAETWIVRKPTADGIVTSLELFNKDGILICTLFGERKPGIPELESWRNLVSKL